jgi:hypothetical protein
MPRLRTIAHAIKERIEEIEELYGSVVVYHRKNIISEFESLMGKAKGKAVIVRLLDARNTSRAKTIARFSGKYTVSLILAPMLSRQDAVEADLLIETIAEKLHGWWPETIPSNGLVWLDVDSITFPDDPDYDVSVLTLQAPKISD